jgi:CRISPR-associated protein Cmr5
MKTLEQEMAGKVYQKVSAMEKSSDAKQYDAMAHKLPILVRTAGLAEALAFVESRGKNPDHALLSHLADVVNGVSKDEFLRTSRDADLQEYIRLTRRTMLALKWFKRFAQSVLKVDPTTADDGGTQ